MFINYTTANNKMLKNAGFSSELIIKPYRSGIQLVKPDEASGNSLGDLFDAHYPAFFMSTESRNIGVNEAYADLCAAQSCSDLIGVSAHDLWDKENASKMQVNDKHIITKGSQFITDYSAIRNQDFSPLQLLSFKLPWYQDDKIIGLYGMTLKFNTLSLGEFTKNLNTILAYGIVKGTQLSNLQTISQPTECHVYLSKRETDIIKLLVQNFTAKQIAERLYLSKRTVENYLVNIKIKTNCDSKFELIEKFYWKFKADRHN